MAIAAITITASTSVMGACVYCCCGLETMDGQPGAVAAVGGVMAGGAEVWDSGGYFLVFTLPFFPSTRVVAFRLRLVWSKMLGGGPARAPRESDDVSCLDLVAYLDQVLVLVGVERLKTEGVADDDAVAVA